METINFIHTPFLIFNTPFISSSFAFVAAFILIFSFIVITSLYNIIIHYKNKHSPKLTVQATVVSKRMKITHYYSYQDMRHNNLSTDHSYYYITFEVQNGKRIEFGVSNSDYDYLIEGDKGFLSFQGSKYLDFTRDIIETR